MLLNIGDWELSSNGLRVCLSLSTHSSPKWFCSTIDTFYLCGGKIVALIKKIEQHQLKTIVSLFIHTCAMEIHKRAHTPTDKQV